MNWTMTKAFTTNALKATAFASCLSLFFLATVPTAAAQDQIAKNSTRNHLVQKSRILGLVSKDTYRLMNQIHFSKKKFDEKLAVEGLDRFIKNLDPLKLYFTKADVEGFRGSVDDVRSEWRNGKLNLAFKVFNTYLDRVDERVALAEELIDEDYDFTRDEEMIIERDLLEFCDSNEKIKERWRKRIKYSMMLLDVEKEEAEKEAKKKKEKTEAKDEAKSEVNAPKERTPREKLHRRYKSLRKRMGQFSDEDVTEMFLSALTNCYDPHTSYMSPSSYKDFLISLRLQLEGIGASLQSTDDGLTVIRRVIRGGAAAKGKELKVEDKIVSVGQGTSGEMVDITDMRLKDVVSKIRGKAGTIVRLGVIRQGTPGIKTITIKREKIELKDSAARGKVFTEGKKADGSPLKIGVVDLPSFYADMARRGQEGARSTTADVKKILDGFRKEKVDAVVLDLRANGGGSLEEAVNCTGLFIDEGPVCQVKSIDGRTRVLNDRRRGVSWNGPLVVLTSKFSASASEILAGAIQDYDRGIVVGDKVTHGKGTVQNLLNLAIRYTKPENEEDATLLGALKITIQKFYRPSGDSTQKRGVLADVVLPSITTHMDISEGDLDNALAFDKIDTADFEKLNLVNNELFASLSEKSKNRIAKSEEFQKLQRNIQRYLKQKNRTSVTLNKQSYLDERKEFDADSAEKKTLENQINGDEQQEIKRNYYLDEVLRITADYFHVAEGK